MLRLPHDVPQDSSVMNTPPMRVAQRLRPPEAQATTWKGQQYRRVADEAIRQHVMKLLGAHHGFTEVENNIKQLVQLGHGRVECNQCSSFQFTAVDGPPDYADLNKLIHYLPEEWTVSLSHSIDVLLKSVFHLLTSTQVATTQFMDVNVYENIARPGHLLVVHGSYSSERPGRNRVKEMLFGPDDPLIALTVRIRVIGLMPSFVDVDGLGTPLTLRRLQEAIHFV